MLNHPMGMSSAEYESIIDGINTARRYVGEGTWVPWHTSREA